MVTSQSHMNCYKTIYLFNFVDKATKTSPFKLSLQRHRPTSRSRLSSLESSVSEAGESDAGDNGNFRDPIQ